jgi:hypothetical protein
LLCDACFVTAPRAAPSVPAAAAAATGGKPASPLVSPEVYQKAVQMLAAAMQQQQRRTHCPACETPYVGGVRTLQPQLEQAAAHVRPPLLAPCVHRECTARVAWDVLGQHARRCAHAPLKCMVCPKPFQASAPALASHYASAHAGVVRVHTDAASGAQLASYTATSSQVLLQCLKSASDLEAVAWRRHGDADDGDANIQLSMPCRAGACVLLQDHGAPQQRRTCPFFITVRPVSRKRKATGEPQGGEIVLE